MKHLIFIYFSFSCQNCNFISQVGYVNLYRKVKLLIQKTLQFSVYNVLIKKTFTEFFYFGVSFELVILFCKNNQCIKKKIEFMIFLSNTSTDVCEQVYVYIYEHSNAHFKLYKYETSIVPIKMRFTYGLSLLSRIKMSLFNNLAWDQNVVPVPFPLSCCNTVVPWHHVLFFRHFIVQQ